MKVKLSPGYMIAIGAGVLAVIWLVMKNSGSGSTAAIPTTDFTSPYLVPAPASISSSGIQAADSISLDVTAPTLQFNQSSTY